ncbi:MAG: TonB-dependent receptor [Mariprofundales bacterium]
MSESYWRHCCCNPKLESEIQWGYEVGYRGRANDRLSLDVSLYFNRLRKSGTTETAGTTTHSGNGMYGNSYGGELDVRWQVLAGWRLKGGYSYLNLHGLRQAVASIDNNVGFTVGSNASQMVSLRSQLDLPWRVQFDSALYYVGRLSHDGNTNFPDPIPAYTRVDARIGWSPIKHLQLSLAANDLFDQRRSQFTCRRTNIEIGRSLHAEATWQWD